MIILRTERLFISDHHSGDLQSMHELFSNPSAMYYLSETKTSCIEETLKRLNTAIMEIDSENRSKYYFKIEDIERQQYIGEIGYTVRLDTPLGKVVELGYFILPEFWGKGITTEAAHEVIRFAFEENGVIKVEAGCIKDNNASEKVMLKIGMIKEADYKMRVRHEGTLKDRVEYRILSEEWERLKGATVRGS